METFLMKLMVWQQGLFHKDFFTLSAHVQRPPHVYCFNRKELGTLHYVMDNLQPKTSISRRTLMNYNAIIFYKSL